VAPLPRMKIRDDVAVITARIDQMVEEARQYWRLTSDEEIAVKLGDRALNYFHQSLRECNEESIFDALMYHAAEIGILYCVQQWGASLARFDAAREGYVETEE
jgi:hypothetical protein